MAVINSLHAIYFFVGIFLVNYEPNEKRKTTLKRRNIYGHLFIKKVRWELSGMALPPPERFGSLTPRI